MKGHCGACSDVPTIYIPHTSSKYSAQCWSSGRPYFLYVIFNKYFKTLAVYCNLASALSPSVSGKVGCFLLGGWSCCFGYFREDTLYHPAIFLPTASWCDWLLFFYAILQPSCAPLADPLGLIHNWKSSAGTGSTHPAICLEILLSQRSDLQPSLKCKTTDFGALLALHPLIFRVTLSIQL